MICPTPLDCSLVQSDGGSVLLRTRGARRYKRKRVGRKEEEQKEKEESGMRGMRTMMMNLQTGPGNRHFP